MSVGELRTWSLYLSKVQDPDRVIEAGLARLAANYAAVHTKDANPKVSDYMTNRDPWGEAEDMSIFNSIAAAITQAPSA